MSHQSSPKIGPTIIVFMGFALAAPGLISAQPSVNGTRNGSGAITLGNDLAVYVVGLETTSRDMSLTSGNLEIERKAKKQFQDMKTFAVADTLSEADFVFLVVLDDESSDFDEIALAVPTRTYIPYRADLDALRMGAFWQDSGRLNRGKEAAIAGATLGFSGLIRRVSVAKDLVKKFHKEAAGRTLPFLIISDRQRETPAEGRGPQGLAQSRSVPPELSQDSGEYLIRRLSVWRASDAAFVLGEPIRSSVSRNTEGEVIGRFNIYRDPSGRYQELKLGFAEDTGLLTNVMLAPWKMTWDECRDLWGENVDSEKYANGNVTHRYRDRHLDVVVNSLGQVLALIVY